MSRRVCGTAPKFYGKRVSLKIFLRRKLGREKKLRAIKKIGHNEESSMMKKDSEINC